MDYFTFEIDGKKCGYYEESDEGGVLYANATMEMQGEKFSNPFWVKYEGDKVLAYKFADGEYIDFKEAENVYPSSATRLLLRKMNEQKKDILAYTFFNEGEGKAGAKITLKRNGKRIEEYTGDKIGRYFVFADDKIVEYCWSGSAKSKRVASL